MKKMFKFLFLMMIIMPVYVSASSTFYFECDKTSINKGQTTNCNLIIETTDSIDSLYAQVKISDENAFELSNFQKGEYGIGSSFETGKFGLYQLGNITGKKVIGTFEVKAIGNSEKTAILTFDKTDDEAYAYLADDITKSETTTKDLTLKITNQGSIIEVPPTADNVQIIVYVGIIIFIAFGVLIIKFTLNKNNS